MRDKQRLEAFTDGVMAVIITLMVLELRRPEGADFSALRPLLSHVLIYLLSFIYIGIYWNNHHNFFGPAERVTGSVLWANLNLLFWLSLVPFTTAWLGEHFESVPAALYGIVLLLASIAYRILEHTLAKEHRDTPIATVAQAGVKEKLSSLVYAVGVLLSFVKPWLGALLYVAVALMWLVPDRRMERTGHRPSKPHNKSRP
jgi:uncharacterized membrane protein